MHEGKSEKVHAAMRVLGISPQHVNDAEGLGDAIDELKRTLIDDFESSRKISEVISRDSLVKTMILSALSQMVIDGVFPGKFLEEYEVRAEKLRPGMFARIKGEHSVVISVRKIGSGYDTALAIDTIQIGGHEDGRGGCMYAGIAGSQIFSASIGVADKIDRWVKKEQYS